MDQPIWRWLLAAGVAYLLAACDQPEEPQPERAATSEANNGVSESPGGSTGSGAEEGSTGVDWPVKDLSERPQIWFGPLDPFSWERRFPQVESNQFFDLFEPDAPWQIASEATHVMRLYSAWMDEDATDSELRMVMDSLREREIAITFEAGPLQERGACNAATVEGFGGAPSVRRIVERIDAAGGVLYGYDLQHGLDAATFSTQACYMTPTEVAEDAATTVAVVRDVFPEAKIGSIETANLDVNLVKQWITAYREVVGEDLAYFHLDVNFFIPDWALKAYEIEQYVRSQGIPFGMIYFGNYDATSDEEWINTAQQRLYEYELVSGGRPDHVIFQSWHEHPQTFLPETQPGTFTNYLLQYLRTRTTLNVAAQPQDSGGLALTGTLTGVDGAPIANAPLSFEAIPVDGPGVIAEYTVTGVVPEGATQADVGFRVNMECDCSGPSEFTLYEARYGEGGETGSRVPNFNFSSGFNGWGSFGAVNPQIVGSDRGGGNALRVDTDAGQSVGVNSTSFPVTGGAAFTLTVVARVAPGSEGSGYFSLIFLTLDSEVQRQTIALEPGSAALGEGVTAGDGAFSFPLAENPVGRTAYRVWYGGDSVYWPALGEVEAGP